MARRGQSSLRHDYAHSQVSAPVLPAHQSTLSLLESAHCRQLSGPLFNTHHSRSRGRLLATYLLTYRAPGRREKATYLLFGTTGIELRSSKKPNAATDTAASSDGSTLFSGACTRAPVPGATSLPYSTSPSHVQPCLTSHYPRTTHNQRHHPHHPQALPHLLYFLTYLPTYLLTYLLTCPGSSTRCARASCCAPPCGW